MITAKFSEIFMEIKSEDNVEIQIRPYVQDISCDVVYWEIDDVKYWRIVLPTELVGLCLYHFNRIGFFFVEGLTNKHRHLSCSDFLGRLCEIEHEIKAISNGSQSNTSAVQITNNDELVVVSIKPSEYDSYVQVNNALLAWIFQIGINTWVSVLDMIPEKLINTMSSSAFEKLVYETYVTLKNPQKK